MLQKIAPLLPGLFGAIVLNHAAPAMAENDPLPAAQPVDRVTAPLIGPIDEDRASRVAAIGGLTISANATLATQYRFRGTNLSGDQVAIQGGVDLDHSSGFYIGVWGSSLNDRTTGYGGAELDIYGGYNWTLIEGVTADLGVIAYTFPDAPAGGANFVEFYSSLSASLGPATGKVGIAVDPGANGFAFAGLVRDNLYAYSDLSVGIPRSRLTLKGHIGYTDGTRSFATNSGAFDWSVGASYKLAGPISASIEYVDAASDARLGPINPNAANLVGKLSLFF